MRTISTLRAGGVVIALFVAASTAEAARHIWVGDNKESSWGEGYYRQNPEPDDEIQREADGETPKAAAAKVSAGDELIIITHGNAGTITVGGQRYGGFSKQDGEGGGTGADCDAYPIPNVPGANITITLHVCNSATDPDGTGEQRTVVESLEDLVTGDGSTVTGKDGTVAVAYTPAYKEGTVAQKANTLQCLADAAAAAGFAGDSRVNDWLASMTYAEHQTLKNNAIQACSDAGDDVVNINITYSQPARGGGRGGPVPPLRAIPRGGPVEDLAPHVATPCSPQCGSVIPTVSEWSLIAMAVLILALGVVVMRRTQHQAV